MENLVRDIQSRGDTMRDLATVLQTELQAVEAELAADPRFRKAVKIRELLEICGAPPGPGPIGMLSECDMNPLAVTKKDLRIHRIWLAIQMFIRPKGTATLARARLMEVAQSDHLPNPTSAWLHRQSGRAGHPTSREKVQLSPLSSVTTEIASGPKL